MPGPTEMIIVLLIVLVIFGAGKLPQVFESFGTGIRKFREAQKEGYDAEDVTPAAKEIPEGYRADSQVVSEKQSQDT